MDEQTKPRITGQTLAAQGTQEPVTKALVSPIHMSATFLRDPDNGYHSGYVYGHTDNASVQQASGRTPGRISGPLSRP
jgi:cystathionine gamma-synthase